MRYLIDCSNYFRNNFNLGDAAIYQMMVRRIRDNDKAAKITWITREPDRMKGLCGDDIETIDVESSLDRDSYGCGEHISLTPDGCAVASQPRPIFSHLPSDVRQVHEAILGGAEQADIVLASGGGYFSDAFPQHAIGVLDTLAAGLSTRKPAALFGIGFEPLSHLPLIKKAGGVLPKLNLIACREGLIGPYFLEQLGCDPSRISVTGDDAVELAFENRPLTFGDCIGVNLRQATYSNVDESHLEQLASALAQVSQKCRAPLVPMPISIFGPSDEMSIRRTIGNFATAEGMPTNLSELFAQLKRCRMLVTGSYHAAVFALSMGISVVAVSNSTHYESKLKGLSNQFGNLGCRVIKLDDVDAQAKLEAATLSIWDEAENYRARLLEFAERQIIAGKSAYSRIIEMV